MDLVSSGDLFKRDLTKTRKQPVPQKIETWKELLERIEEPSTIDLYYEEEGSGEETLLLIHGFGQSLYTWRHLMPPLSKKYRLILVDLKGFGKSPKPKDGRYTLYEQVKLVLHLIKKLDLSRLTLMGHSFGGGVALITALYLTLFDKGRVERTVLIDNPAYEQKLPPFVSILKVPVISDLGMALIPAKIQIRSLLKLSYLHESTITNDAVAAYAKPLYTPGGRQALINTARQMVPSDLSGLSKRYEKIDLPVQLIWGAKDAIIPVGIGLKLEKALPHGWIKVFPDCGHVPQEEKPEETFELIEAFLSSKH
ncbi:MAG: alpha/beta hydrolase [Deltaproteobacteria bacterium]|nr:alpha/beta hydrolase [Deltaproteobacteria bacterium]